MSRGIRVLLAALAALSLAGCINSAKPILTDAKPVFGQRINLQFYTLSDGVATEPSQVQFTWNGSHYVRSSGADTTDAFSVYPFEAGDYLVQNTPGKPSQKIEYVLLHKLVDGVFLARIIDEEDADAATRAKLCAKSSKYSCRITTRDQLLTFARATAARRHTSGGLVIRLPDKPAK